MIRHRTAAKRLSQSRYGGAVSDPGLVIDVDETHCPAGDGERPAFLVADIRGAVVADRFQAVDHLTLIVLFYKIGVTRIFDQAGDSLQGPVPIFFFPLVALRRPIQHLAQAVLIDLGQTEKAGTFGAERTFVDRMIRVPFDVEDLAGQPVGAADKAATDGTVTTDRCRLFGRPYPVHLAEPGSMSLQGGQIQPKRGQG